MGKALSEYIKDEFYNLRLSGLTQTEARVNLNLSKSSGIKLDKEFNTDLPQANTKPINYVNVETEIKNNWFMDILYNMWHYITKHKYGFILFIIVACVVIALLVVIYNLIQSHHDEMIAIMLRQQKKQEDIEKERDSLKKQVGKLELTVSKLEEVVENLYTDKKQAEERYEFILKNKANII